MTKSEATNQISSTFYVQLFFSYVGDKNKTTKANLAVGEQLTRLLRNSLIEWLLK